MMRNVLLALGVSLALAGTRAPALAQGGGRSGEAASKAVPLDRIVAVVSKTGIALSELYETANDENERRRANGQPPFQGDTNVFIRRILDGMIDAKLLLHKAEEFKFPIKEEEITSAVDQQIKQIRAEYKTEQEFLADLRAAGINSPDVLRRRFIEQERHRRLQKMTIDTLTRLGQMPTVSVSEKEIAQAFDSLKATLGRRGATVTFRQIIVKPVPADTADARARALADSLLGALRAGANFDSLARKFSDDTGSAVHGGDLDWFRRGVMMPAFDAAAFSLQVGQISPVIKTDYGYHIIRVDRVRTGEVRARHILIMPKKSAGDVVRAHATAERVRASLAAGASFDSLSELYHDGAAHRRKVENIQLDSLPAAYVDVLTALKADAFSAVFDVVMPDGTTKAGLLQLQSRNESGDWTLAELRSKIRSDLQTAGSWRRLLDGLRKQTYVAILLDDPAKARSQK